MSTERRRTGNYSSTDVNLNHLFEQITLKRAFTTLTLWQKIKFGYTILTYKDTITAEEVEQCKQKDLLESMLEEIAGTKQCKAV